MRSSVDESEKRENLEHAGLAGWCPGCASVPRGRANRKLLEAYREGGSSKDAVEALPGQGSREEDEEDEVRSRRRRTRVGSDDGADVRRRDPAEPESEQQQRRRSESEKREEKSWGRIIQKDVK